MEWAVAHGIRREVADVLVKKRWEVAVLLSSRNIFVEALDHAGEDKGPATKIWLKLQSQGTARSILSSSEHRALRTSAAAVTGRPAVLPLSEAPAAGIRRCSFFLLCFGATGLLGQLAFRPRAAFPGYCSPLFLFPREATLHSCASADSSSRLLLSLPYHSFVLCSFWLAVQFFLSYADRWS